MNIRTEKILSAILISMLVLSIPMVLVPKARASPAVVRLYPDSPIVLGDATGTDIEGQEFSVAAVVEDIVGAFGGDVIISWNTTYFDYVSHNFTMPWNGTTLSDTGPSPYLGFLYSPGFPVEDLVDTVAGTYSAAYASSRGANAFSGNGTFCSVKLKVKKQPDSTDIGLGNYLNITMDIFYSKIVNESAEEITPPIEDGFVYLYSKIFRYPPVPMLKVMPENIDGIGVGNTHTVDVWLMAAGETDLHPFWDPGGFEIQMNFDTSLLNATDVTIGGWFAGPTSSFWPTLLEIEKTIDNDAGTIVVVFLGYAAPGETHNPVEGKGILFTATFIETYESATFPPPCAPITLQVPHEYEPGGFHNLHSNAGMIELITPVGTDWNVIDTYMFWTPFHVDDWTDEDGDGELSEGDQLKMTDGDTGKWRDYTLQVLTGTLDITQEELNVTDTLLACPTPENLSLSMPNLGINDVYMYMGNGTERYLDPSEYTENSTHVGIKGSLDSYVCDTFTVGLTVTLDSWNGFSNYVGAFNTSVRMGGVDYIEATNSTHTWILNGTDGHDYSWWECDDWWILEAVPGLSRGDTLIACYWASSVIAVNYKTVEADPDRYVEYEGEYADWLTSLNAPISSEYKEIWPNSVRSPYHVIDWLDEDTNGVVTAGDKLIMEYTRTGGIGRYLVNDLATDMYVARKRCICGDNVLDEFYCNEIKAKIAGVAHPDRDMCPWHNNVYSVLLPHVVEDATYCASVAVAVGVDVFTQYESPFGGQGVMRPSDMFWSQKEVCLFAYASYNFWPEQNKDVAFKVIDPYGETYAVLYGRTNEVGIAEACFRLPWMCDDPEYYFGEWTVIALVDIASTSYSDTLWFKYDHLVNTWKVTTDKDEYAHCEEIAITVEYGSYAMHEFEITYTVTILDDSGVPFGYVEVTFTVGGAQYCTYENGSFTVNLHAEKWARAGMATIHVGAVDSRGAPITPGKTSTVYILAE